MYGRLVYRFLIFSTLKPKDMYPYGAKMDQRLLLRLNNHPRRASNILAVRS